MIVVELFLKSVCLPLCLTLMLLVGKTSEETNLVPFIENIKVYYDGDFWFVLCIQHHFSPATH